jgi:hypothetical protein
MFSDIKSALLEHDFGRHIDWRHRRITLEEMSWLCENI